MRTLHPARLELIDALVAETALGGITAGLLEKDEHLTDALRALLALPLDGLSLAFCGGTSLSKAHGLIKHLSEDADLKIVLPTDAQALFKTQLRKRMSELKRALLSLIYGNSTPEFNEAFAGFERVALAFLASLQKLDEATMRHFYLGQMRHYYLAPTELIFHDISYVKF